MKTWVLLLRGINVGGHHRLPMDDLKRHLRSFDVEDVRTYIQSGNVVFRAEESSVSDLPSRLSSLIEEHHGFEPSVMLLSRSQLDDAIAANPFPEAVEEPKTLHLFFLAESPENPDLSLLEDVQAASERFQLTDEVFYLHTPDGLGRSKLVAKIGKSLGVDMTARNWRTVDKLRQMASS